MKKLLILGIIFLSSCGEKNLITRNGKPETTKTSQNYYIVDKIVNKSNGLCKYYLSTGQWINYKWEIEFIDSIDKYKLNQKLYTAFEPVK